VSHGIISALGRHVGVTEYEDFIQTDAAINPGNSGGPLVNLKGEVIGINTVIATKTGTNIGIGFAIPSNLVKSVYTELRSKGKVTRGWLGVGLQELTPDLLKKFGVDYGVRISGVVKNSPAEKAGIKLDDIITEFDGKKIARSEQLRELVSTTKVGKTVQIILSRNHQTLVVKAAIVEMPSDSARLFSKDLNIDLGITVQNITPQIARKLRLNKVAGVVVSEVSRGSFADNAGVQTGDVILEINDTTIKNTDDYDRVVAKLQKGDKVFLRIYRGGYIILVTFETE
jgi:serine protease Do